MCSPGRAETLLCLPPGAGITGMYRQVQPTQRLLETSQKVNVRHHLPMNTAPVENWQSLLLTLAPLKILQPEQKLHVLQSMGACIYARLLVYLDLKYSAAGSGRLTYEETITIS